MVARVGRLQARDRPLAWWVAMVRSFGPQQRKIIQVISCDSESMLEVARNLIAPASNAYTCGAQCIKRTNGAVWLDKPAVLQRISKQEHTSSSGGRHRRIEKTGPGPFCGSTGHVTWALLLIMEMNKRASLKPQLARPTQRDLIVVGWVRHDGA